MKNTKLKTITSIITAALILSLCGCSNGTDSAVSAESLSTVSSDKSVSEQAATSGEDNVSGSGYGSWHYDSSDLEDSLNLEKNKVYDGFPTNTDFCAPKRGGNTVLSYDEKNGVKASAVLMCIGAFPNDNAGMWAADGVYVVVTDSEGRAAYNKIPTPRIAEGQESICTGFTMKFPAECVCGYSTRLFEVEQNGRKHTILMQYTDINKDGTIYPTFFDCDLKENTAESGETGLPVYSVQDKSVKADGRTCTPISDKFEYVEGTTFKDTQFSYTITFDCEKFTAEVVYN